MRNSAQNVCDRRGSSLVEFALVGTFMFIPILGGLVAVGLSLVASQQVQNLNGNAGQMFAGGVDFTQATNQSLLWKLAGGLNGGTLTPSASGQIVVILSEIDGPPDSNSTGNTCSNQIVMGNTAIGTSQYCPTTGSPPSTAFTNLMGSLAIGQKSYIAETFYNNPLYTWAQAPAGTHSGIYTFALF